MLEYLENVGNLQTYREEILHVYLRPRTCWAVEMMHVYP